MNSIRRPRPGEDDLEEMMKQFEPNKTTPSVTVVNKREENKSSLTTSSGTKKKSLFSQKRAADKKNQENIKFQLCRVKRELYCSTSIVNNEK